MCTIIKHLSPLTSLHVVSPHGSILIVEAVTTAGSAAFSAEVRKHSKNGQKCTELGMCPNGCGGILSLWVGRLNMFFTIGIGI